MPAPILRPLRLAALAGLLCAPPGPAGAQRLALRLGGGFAATPLSGLGALLAVDIAPAPRLLLRTEGRYVGTGGEEQGSARVAAAGGAVGARLRATGARPYLLLAGGGALDAREGEALVTVGVVAGIAPYRAPFFLEARAERWSARGVGYYRPRQLIALVAGLAVP